jgi:predicted small lipoprotein YifL
MMAACGRGGSFYNDATSRDTKDNMMNRPHRTALVLALVTALAACGGGRKLPTAAGIAPSKITTIGVNSYLWRATLDTLSFMPMAQVDSNGGVVVTDWYVNPALPGERMKVSVAILDQDLRSDAVRVAVSRQVSQGGQWTEAAVQAATVQKLEEIILSKARDLRRSSVAG